MPGKDLPHFEKLSQRKKLKEIEVVAWQTPTVTKLEALNGPGSVPPGRCKHQSVLIGTEPGEKMYLVVYGGLDSNKHILSDMNLFDFFNHIWIPVAQSGFIPVDEFNKFGRHSFSM